MTGLLLARTGPAAPAFPGQDLAALHAAAAAEIASRLGPAHAAILAQPSPEAGSAPGGTAWRAEGAEFRRFVDLDAASRRALLTAAGAILSDIRRLAESGTAPAVAAAWPGLAAIPDTTAVFAVDGRPVLAPWGHPAAGEPVLARFDDGRRFVPPPRTDWRPAMGALACVALLALAAGLLLPGLARWAVPEPAMCRIDPGQLDLMRRQTDAELRGETLKRLLASVNDDIGRKQLMCPIRTVQAPPAPRPLAPQPQPTPPPPPPPRADLPQQRWDEHDLSLLSGCWHNVTQMNTHDITSGRTLSVREWRICFDESGRGRQSITWNDGIVCNGPMTAQFSRGNDLVLTDTTQCTAGTGRYLYRGRLDCTRTSDAEASCVRVQTDGPGSGSRQPGTFRK